MTVMLNSTELKVWECKAGGLKKLTQKQYDAQPEYIKRHYTKIPENTSLDKAVSLMRDTLRLLDNVSTSTGYCCCGSKVDTPTILDGHSPVDEGNYYALKLVEDSRNFINSVT